MNKEKISIIIPAYNAERTIRRTLDSVFSQSYKNLEVICINDGSKDSTPEILKEYSLKHSNLIVINKENGGVSDSRNKGLDRSTGDYILFLDSDDNYVCNDAIEKMYKIMKEKNVDMVICNFVHPVFQTHLSSGSFNLANKEDFKRLFDDFFVFGMPWNKMIKRQLINARFNKNIAFAEDELFMSELMKDIQSAYYTDEVLINYYCAPKNSERPSAINSIHSKEGVENNKVGFFYARANTTDVRDEVFFKYYPKFAEHMKYQRFFDFIVLDVLFMNHLDIEIKSQLKLMQKIINEKLFKDMIANYYKEYGFNKNITCDSIKDKTFKIVKDINKIANERPDKMIRLCFEKAKEIFFA